MGVNVNPEMVRLAREFQGMTQKELSENSKISQGHISKFEKGQLIIPHQQLKKISDVLKMPIPFFYQKGNIYGLGISNIYHRKRQSLPVQTLKQIQAVINIHTLNISSFLDSIEIKSPYSFESFDIQDFGGDAMYIANLVRAHWRIPIGPINNLIDIIERASGIVIKHNFITNKFDAESRWLKEDGLPPIFFLNENFPTDRMRFTLAHELAHIIMHRIPTPNMEEEANTFASEFLMPGKQILPDLVSFSIKKAARLKSKWRVSIASIIKRAKDLGVISDYQYRRMFTQLGVFGYRKREPIFLEDEKSNFIPKIIDTYKKSLGYTIDDLCNSLKISRQVFDFLYPAIEPFKIVR